MIVETRTVNGVEVEIVGCWDETADGKFEFFDLFVEGRCINLGDPIYEFPPSDLTISVHLANGGLA